MKIITVEKSRELEQRANDHGLSFAQMMENAGRGTALAVQSRSAVKGKRLVVLVGPGNNGGDGLVAGHYLSEMGASVTFYVWKREVEGDANFRRIEGQGQPIVWAKDDTDYEALRGLISAADGVIDALLGVGVSRPIDGTLKEILDVVCTGMRRPPARSGLTGTGLAGEGTPQPLVIAVDCPTGLDCDTGALDPAALSADMTVSFAYPKVGLLRFPGAAAVGDLVIADIGIPPELAEDIPLEMATIEQIRSWLPKRPPSAHKGSFGRALIVAGSVNYVGAAVLAGAAATRVGTGLVTMALPAAIHPAVAAHLTETTYVLLPNDLGVISADAVGVLREQVADYESLLIGPGLTRERETESFVHALLSMRSSERRGHIGFVAASAADQADRIQLPPLVVDADALNALAGADRWWAALPANTVLTPHPGEMVRLMRGEATIQEVQADREGVCRRMAQTWRAVVVLKGAFTVVAAPEGRVMVIPFANAGLATAGSGDVLAGAIAGLRAQGVGAFEAAVAGTFLHGLAGEMARADLGDMGMVAGDLLPRLPLALRRIRQA